MSNSQNLAYRLVLTNNKFEGMGPDRYIQSSHNRLETALAAQEKFRARIRKQEGQNHFIPTHIEERNPDGSYEVLRNTMCN
jgi:hypothetical protein